MERIRRGLPVLNVDGSRAALGELKPAVRATAREEDNLREKRRLPVNLRKQTDHVSGTTNRMRQDHRQRLPLIEFNHHVHD